MSSNHSITTTLAFIREVADGGFWGTITLKFKDGALVHATKEESLLPEQINPKDRRKYESNLIQ